LRAAIYDQFRQPLSIRNVDDPAPPDDGVIIAVKATGICRSDWHGWMGHDPDIRVPHVPGHELAGVIAAKGKLVTRWSVGDRVTVPFVCACGTCPPCASGNQQVCDHQFQPGFTHWGSFAEYVAIHRADLNLVRLPEELTFETAASLGCRFATSFRAVVDQARVTEGQWVAVHGCGGVGLSAIMIARALGARVIAIDIADDKLAFARSIGAHAVIDARMQADIPSAVRDLTGGGAHVSIDALGSPRTCFNSVACLAKRGKHIQVGLLVAEQSRRAFLQRVHGRVFPALLVADVRLGDRGAHAGGRTGGRVGPEVDHGRTLSRSPASLRGTSRRRLLRGSRPRTRRCS